MPQPGWIDADLESIARQAVDGVHQRICDASLTLMHRESLTLPQLVTLHALSRADSLTISGVGALLNLSTSAASHLVERLVERGLVERQESLDDRRQKRVELAPAGSALIDRLMQPHQDELLQLLSTMDGPGRAALVELLKKSS